MPLNSVTLQSLDPLFGIEIYEIGRTTSFSTKKCHASPGSVVKFFFRRGEGPPIMETPQKLSPWRTLVGSILGRVGGELAACAGPGEGRAGAGPGQPSRTAPSCRSGRGTRCCPGGGGAPGVPRVVHKRALERNTADSGTDERAPRAEQLPTRDFKHLSRSTRPDLALALALVGCSPILTWDAGGVECDAVPAGRRAQKRGEWAGEGVCGGPAVRLVILSLHVQVEEGVHHERGHVDLEGKLGATRSASARFEAQSVEVSFKFQTCDFSMVVLQRFQSARVTCFPDRTVGC